MHLSLVLEPPVDNANRIAQRLIEIARRGSRLRKTHERGHSCHAAGISRNRQRSPSIAVGGSPSILLAAEPRNIF